VAVVEDQLKHNIQVVHNYLQEAEAVLVGKIIYQ
jgi:hypothetical protein